MTGVGGTAALVTGELLERDAPLAALEDALAQAHAGRGRLVFVSGEAGIGKSALVRCFCAGAADSARVVLGACDGLWTPRPLGPFADVGLGIGGRLGSAISSGAAAPAVFEALSAELSSAGTTVVVLEDLHLADEATLDVLGLLGRRVEQFGVLVLATYRSDELPRTHQLQILLGELATVPAVGRLRLEPLSPAAVAELAEPHGIDGTELHRTTDGNPFFVTEVLAGGAADVPATVRDAVLAVRRGSANRRTHCSTSWRSCRSARSCGYSRPSLGMRSRRSTSVSARACFGQRAPVSPSATSWRDWRSRSRSTRTAARASTPPCCAPSGSRRTAAPTRRSSPTTPKPPATSRRCWSTHPRRRSEPRRRGTPRGRRAVRTRASLRRRLPAAERASLLEQRSRECYLTDQNDAAWRRSWQLSNAAAPWATVSAREIR